MSDNYTDDDFDTNESDQEQNSGDIKSLRRAASGKKQLEQELDAARRELAFVKAGINPDDPKMRYFVKGYEGDLSAEAVRQAALEAGFLASQPQGGNQELQQAAAAQQRVMNASAGAMYEDASEEAALARLEEAMEEGGVDAMLEVARQYGIPTNIEQ
jgi:ribosomal protein L12E/L44/L45/RPP1/RPP2